MSLQQKIIVELSAVITNVTAGTPCIVVAPGMALPSGPLETQHKKLEQALRAWVASQSGLTLGYVEQLYTFADKDRETDGRRYISIGYLALAQNLADAQTVDWYLFFPWEDYRAGPPTRLMAMIHKALALWKNEAPNALTRKQRLARIAISFPKDPRDWNEELVLQRYELLWEAGLIEEAMRSGNRRAKETIPSLPMAHDHRRILATAIARLRAKIKYRPVVFELMPERFTLLQLQNTVEALAGLRYINRTSVVLSWGKVLLKKHAGKAKTNGAVLPSSLPFAAMYLKSAPLQGQNCHAAGKRYLPIFAPIPFIIEIKFGKLVAITDRSSTAIGSDVTVPRTRKLIAIR